MLGALARNLAFGDFLHQSCVRLGNGGFGLNNAEFVFARLEPDERFALLELCASEEIRGDIRDPPRDFGGKTYFGAGLHGALAVDRDRYRLRACRCREHRQCFNDGRFFLGSRLECAHADEAADRADQHQDWQNQKDESLDQ